MENVSVEVVSAVPTAPVATAVEPPEPAKAPEPAKTVPLKALEDERRKRQAAVEEAAYYRGIADATKPPVAATVTDGPPAEPTLDQFPDNYEAYEKAKDRHLVDLAKYELRQETKHHEEESKKHQTQSQVEENWNKNLKDAQVKYPDFMDAIANPEFRQSDTVAMAIKSSDMGGDLAYFLANNIEETNRLNAMTPMQAAREIGRIEAKILNTPKPTPPPVISQAPEPISTIAAAASAATKELKDLSTEEYMRIRMPKIFNRR